MNTASNALAAWATAPKMADFQTAAEWQEATQAWITAHPEAFTSRGRGGHRWVSPVNDVPALQTGNFPLGDEDEDR